MPSPTLTLKDIEAARERLKGIVLRTPLIFSHTLSRLGGREVYLKLENLQTTGSFKLRGALNRLTLLKERGDPTGNAERENIIFMKPGTTCGFTIHWTQMVPSFPRKASVDASYKQAMEEKTIGKYMAVKRRDQGGQGKDGVIGWETIETAEKGSGGFQRIQWQCYDGQNYMYSFMAHSEPKDFNANRADLQRIIDSIKFGR